MELLPLVLGAVGILLGLMGVIVPVMPGLLLVWLGTAGSLLLHRADVVGWALAALLTALFAVGSLATIVLPTRTGRRGGASLRSFVYAGAGGVIGFFVIPVVGLPVGALAGLMIGEKERLGEWAPARASTVRVLRAYGAGVLTELVIGLVMATIWLAAVLLRS